MSRCPRFSAVGYSISLVWLLFSYGASSRAQTQGTPAPATDPSSQVERSLFDSPPLFSDPPVQSLPKPDKSSPAAPSIFDPPEPPVPIADQPAQPSPGRFPTSLGGGIGVGAGGLNTLGNGTASLAGLGGQGIFVPRVNYSTVWYPDQPVRGQNTDLGMVRQELSLTVPVWRDGADGLTFHANVRSLLYQTDAILPDSGRPFPNALWNIGVGATYTHVFENGWILGGGATIGSSSDQPFHNLTDTNVSVSSFLRVPSGERNAWLFGISYSPTGELAFPVPMVAYIWNPNDQFSMNIGLPFAMRWRPIEDLLFDVSYVPIRNVHSRVTYRIVDGLGIYGGFDWSNESYFLADRTDTNERFFYYEKRLSSGCRYDVTPHAAVDLSGGFAFDRFFFTGENYSDNGHDRVDVGNGLFIALRFQVRF